MRVGGKPAKKFLACKAAGSGDSHPNRFSRDCPDRRGGPLGD
jgi:hypothetical protein